MLVLLRVTMLAMDLLHGFYRLNLKPAVRAKFGRPPALASVPT